MSGTYPEVLTGAFPTEQKEAWRRVFGETENLQEIRLRRGQPVLIRTGNGEFFLSQSGELKRQEEKETLRMSGKDLEGFFRQICRHSPYAYEEETRRGFLTVEGGYRVGVAGQVIRDEKNEIRTIKYIHSVNIRITHEIKNCADPLMHYMFEMPSGRVKNTLILSPPSGGKTTLLRDLVRQLSDGSAFHPGMTVGVVDERSEIAGCYLGCPQNDVGIRTDVMDACPKVTGIRMLIRSMNPQLIAVDEIGSREDFQAVEEAMTCGCGIIATMHANDLDDVFSKYGLQERYERSLFDLYVILERKQNRPGISKIYDRGKTYVSSDGRNFNLVGDAGAGNPVSAENIRQA